MDTLNHKHLFYFYVVAKEGSVKAAAEKLYVSQPTVSDQIRLLEEFFECKLFVREHRSLSLTKDNVDDTLSSGTKDVSQIGYVTNVTGSGHTHSVTIPSSVVNYIIKT